jgi:hypothetical protein
MRSEKIRAFANAVQAYFSALLNSFLAPLAGNFSVAQYRWQANRERYEASLRTNSVQMPKLHSKFSMVHESLADIFDALLIIVFGSALIVTVANSTTGSAAKNGNVSASPGATAIIQLLPFIFVAIIAFSAFDLLRGRRGKSL